MARHGRGEGTLGRRADGLWVGRASLGYEAGKRRRKVVYGKTRREAAERLTAVLRARQQGLPIATQRLTLGTYLGRWLAGVRSNVRGSTWRRYEIIVRCQLVPHLGRISLAKLAPSDLSAAHAVMLSGGLAPRTVGHAHRVLGRALRDAEIDGLIGRNVARIVRVPRVPQREMQTFSAEQCRALLRAAGGDRLAALYHVALASGARQGEVLALRWGDVDLEAGTIHIRRTLLRTPDGFETGEPKSASARRTIPLGRTAMDALRAHRLTQAEERLRVGLGKATDDDLVFASEAGTPIDPSNLLANSYYPLLRRAGLPRLTFHAGTRHTAATLLVASGAHIRTIAERLGHADPALTLRTYSHVSVGLQATATEALEAVLRA